jgi:hypothetical protein
VLEIGAKSVRFARTSDDGASDTQEVAADSVLIATGLVPNRVLAEALRGKGLAVVEIGDGQGVGYIEGAIHGGFEAAAQI